jgi:hypothetical protein
MIFTAIIHGYKENFFNRLDSFNEFMICLIALHLTGFSDRIDDYEL